LYKEAGSMQNPQQRGNFFGSYQNSGSRFYAMTSST